MPIRAYTFRDENALAKFMTERGMSHHEVGGPYFNMSGGQFILVDEGASSNVPPSGIPSVGVSFGISDEGTPNVAVVGSLYTGVTGESLGAATVVVADTLAHATVIPNSVVVKLTGSTFTLKDNGRGQLISTIDSVVRGSVDYFSGAIAIKYWPQDRIGGDVEVDYSYSDAPTATGMPDKIELVGLTLQDGTGSAEVTVQIYDDVNQYSLSYVGTTTLDGDGKGFLNLHGALSVAVDPRESKRWVVITGSDAYTVLLQWRRADM